MTTTLLAVRRCDKCRGFGFLLDDPYNGARDDHRRCVACKGKGEVTYHVTVPFELPEAPPFEADVAEGPVQL